MAYTVRDLLCVASCAYAPRSLFALAWAFKLSVIVLLLVLCSTQIHDFRDTVSFLRFTFWAYALVVLLPVVLGFLSGPPFDDEGRMSTIVTSNALSPDAAAVSVLALTLYSRVKGEGLRTSAVLVGTAAFVLDDSRRKQDWHRGWSICRSSLPCSPPAIWLRLGLCRDRDTFGIRSGHFHSAGFLFFSLQRIWSSHHINRSNALVECCHASDPAKTDPGPRLPGIDFCAIPGECGLVGRPTLAQRFCGSFVQQWIDRVHTSSPYQFRHREKSHSRFCAASRPQMLFTGLALEASPCTLTCFSMACLMLVSGDGFARLLYCFFPLSWSATNSSS